MRPIEPPILGSPVIVRGLPTSPYARTATSLENGQPPPRCPFGSRLCCRNAQSVNAFGFPSSRRCATIVSGCSMSFASFGPIGLVSVLVVILPRDSYQRALFLFFLLFFAGSCVAPPYLQYLLMQHVPTVLAAFLLAYLSNRFVISRLSFSSIILFLCLHTLGARYLYSYVPYDVWSEKLLGVNLSETFGFQRNHYDRLVHFSYGLLLAVPVQEFERRYLRLSTAISSVLAIEFIIATSASYELIEWLVAVVFTPEWAEQFLGQQGDIFDAQKDTALATAGAVVSIIVLALTSRRHTKGT